MKFSASIAVAGADLATARQAQGLSQSQVARKLRVTTLEVSHWEQGMYLPSSATLDAWGDLLGVGVELRVNMLRHRGAA